MIYIFALYAFTFRMSHVYVSKKMAVLCIATQILSYFESSTKIRINMRHQALCVGLVLGLVLWYHDPEAAFLSDRCPIFSLASCDLQE